MEQLGRAICTGTRSFCQLTFVEFRKDNDPPAVWRLRVVKVVLRSNKFKNPYGEGGASKKIINILESINYDNILQKHSEVHPTANFKVFVD